MRSHRLAVLVVGFLFAALVASPLLAEGGPTPIGNFGPTGLEVTINEDLTLSVLNVQPGSPAVGKFAKGDTITAINGMPPVQAEPPAGVVFPHRTYLAKFITDAEAGDGKLTFSLKTAKGARDAVIELPVLGSYSKTWPIGCGKTDKIIRANADYLHSIAGANGENFTGHTMADAWAILSLLATGEQKDLELVRKVYKSRMATFTPDQVGSHNWHNGMQGIAVCEYYLRTGDKSVMPLIDEICEKIRKYQVQGGWSHWAKGINPQYTAGGHMNAAGTQNLTTLLLATMCGADVDSQATRAAMRYFFRFVGHGATPYGDHRPEGGYGSNNGKTEMVGVAMSVAARATDGQLYALARDKNTAASLYTYPHILRGHTGGFGTLWYGVASGWMAEKKPALYHNRFENLRWFYELSRRFDGSFGSSGAGRYDNPDYGRAVVLGLSAPRKTLQITGAPTSPYAKPFTLPERVWGRPADVVFLTIDGGPAYKPLDLPPHLEREAIKDLDAEGLRRMASHPEQVYRQTAADAIRDKRLFGLVEELLESDDWLAKQTACRVMNTLEPWRLRHAKDYRARLSMEPEDFTPRMFKGLMTIITDPDAPLWSVDQALIACAAATRAQVASRLDDILPYLEHKEWYLNEAATIALTPAMSDEAAMKKILPKIARAIATNLHNKPRGVMSWAVGKGTANAPASVKAMVANLGVELFKTTPSVPNTEPGVDISGITSVSLEGALWSILENSNWHWQVSDDPRMVVAAAELVVDRLDDFRPRELGRSIDMLIRAGGKLEGANRKALGTILTEHFRPVVIGDDPAGLKERMHAGDTKTFATMNKLLDIDGMAGVHDGWQVFGRDAGGQATWWHTSFEPDNKPGDSEYNRFRAVDVPNRLADWYKPAYDPKAHGWTREQHPAPAVVPGGYAVAGEWFADDLADAGEAIFIRKTFELKDLDYVEYRLSVFSRQGYEVYLNGQKLAADGGRSKTWQARQRYFDAGMKKHLKVGTNVIAVRSFLQYFRGKDGGVDVFVEGLRSYPKID